MRAMVPALLVAGAVAGCGRTAATDVSVDSLTLVPLGTVSDRNVSIVRKALQDRYRLDVRVGKRRPLPKEAFYAPRQRYRADHLVRWLAKADGEDKVLGVAAADISMTARGHKDWGIVGLAQLGKRGAVVSVFRLKGSAGKIGDVAVHEVGHLLGRDHCPTVDCTMHDAEGKVRKIGNGLCGDCRNRLASWLR